MAALLLNACGNPVDGNADGNTGNGETSPTGADLTGAAEVFDTKFGAARLAFQAEAAVTRGGTNITGYILNQARVNNTKREPMYKYLTECYYFSKLADKDLTSANDTSFS